MNVSTFGTSFRLDPQPHSPGAVRAFGWALLMHGFLLAALTWGVHWKNSTREVAFEAELWSSIPQEAAPRLIETLPPPPEVASSTPALLSESDIALERRKEKERLQKQADEEQAKRDASKQARELEAQKIKDRLREDKLRDKLRADNLKRILGQAGATGADTATGRAQHASGPSAEYAGRIRARIRPNIVFTENVAGNPTAVIEVHCTADGTIVSKVLLQKSGHDGWDAAALKSLDRTRVLPRDVDGRVPSPMILELRPKD